MPDKQHRDHEPAHVQLTLERVLRHIRRRGAATSGTVKDATFLSDARVNSLINQLRDAGVIEVADRRISNRRRVMLTPTLGCLVGVDMNLDRATVAISDLNYGLMGAPKPASDRVPIDDCDATLDRIAQMVATQVAKRAAGRQLVGLGLGLPGPVQRGSGAPESDHLLPNWRGVPVAERLQRRLSENGVRAVDGRELPVAVVNDASLGALGVITRARWGNPEQPPDDLVYVRVSHGIGMGLIAGGALITGARGFAGEIGHVRVKPDGPVCTRCNRKGCLEVLASERAVVDNLRRHAWADKRPVPRDADDVRRADDARTRDEVGTAGWHLGFVMAAAANVLNPAWVVLGGKLPEMEIFRSKFDAALRSYALPQVVEDIRVVTWQTLFDDKHPATLPDVGSALTPELLGALAVVGEEFGDDFLRPYAALAAASSSATL